MIKMNLTVEQWAFDGTFTIARSSLAELDIIVCQLEENGMIGRGEAVPVDYAGETVESVLSQLNAINHKIRKNMKPQDIQILLPHGAARNALDCALWDLEAQRQGKPAWEIAGLSEFPALPVTYTLGINSPEVMQAAAEKVSHLPLLKVKLKGDGLDMDRMRAVRAGSPKARLIVDANEGWNKLHLEEYVPILAELGVELIEQPVMAGSDHILDGFNSLVPLCADESCNDVAALDYIADRYQFINIKLDKTGGLTEALTLAKVAQNKGLRLMVGCMCGTSLGMAPAAIIGQMCEYVDLDGPLLMADDRSPAINYNMGIMTLPNQGLWG